MNKDDIGKLADLARIELDEAEKEALAREIEPILSYVGAVKGVQAESAIPTHRNVSRSDEVLHESGYFTESLLENAPKVKDGYIEVKKIIGSSQ